ncbi:MAG: winged helix-turn-helix domain-containing protein [Candidatus Hodarchaeales archaeon]|jgi:DNA-binding HxlR family transcriptional regulator
MNINEAVRLFPNISSNYLKRGKPLDEIQLSKYTYFLSRKWIIDILYILQISNRSFSELGESLGISNQELSRKLKILKSYNLVKKIPGFMNEKDLSTYESALVAEDLTVLIQNLGKFSKKYLE